MEKRRKFLKKKHKDSGITDDVKAVLSERKMVPDDLKYLPACEVKDILSGNHPNQRSANKTFDAKVDTYKEEGITAQIAPRTIQKVKESVSAETQFEGGYFAEFSKITLNNHRRLMKQYVTEKLNAKIEEKGSMYGQASKEVSQRVLELRANPEISKVQSMFDDREISAHYGEF